MQKNFLWIGLGLGCLGAVIAWCMSASSPLAESKTAGLSPAASPKEKLDEERLAQAIRGLAVNGETLRAASAGHDRALAQRLAANADARFESENVWFETVGRFRDAILADPTYAPAYEGLHRALLMEGEVDLAEKALRTALAIDKKYERARFALATVRQMKGDYAGAVAQWKNLAGQNPAYPDTYARMAIASYYAEDYSSSWKYLGEAEKRKQNVPPQFKDLLKEVAPKP